jgi:hypothetical protein
MSKKKTVKITFSLHELIALRKALGKATHLDSDLENLWWRKTTRDETNERGYPLRVVDSEMVQVTYDVIEKVQDALEQAKERDPDGERQYQGKGF